MQASTPVVRGLSPLHYACFINYFAAAKLLLVRGAKVSLLSQERAVHSTPRSLVHVVLFPIREHRRDLRDHRLRRDEARDIGICLFISYHTFRGVFPGHKPEKVRDF